MTNQDILKKQSAEAALDFIESGMIVGIGTGSTVNFFIDALARVKRRIDGAVSTSEASTARLQAHGIPVLDLNSIASLSLYVDGADEFNRRLQLIKGGGGALTREKIVARASVSFVCITDQTKQVETLGKFPLPVEVIPMARRSIEEELIKCGGQPVLREGFITDNGNVILDVHNLAIEEPETLESRINDLPGVVTNGIFSIRPANVLLMGTSAGVEIIRR